MQPVILMRTSLAEEEELQVARKYFPVYTSRSAVPAGSLVIGRYSVLPYYSELVEDLAVNSSSLCNSSSEHSYVADIQNYYPDLEGLTPQTWFSLADFQSSKREGSFVLKGATNSKKGLWSTHMFAKTQKDVTDVYCRLMNDGLVGGQDIYIRQYVPLRSFGVGCADMPITEEYRFFVYNGTVVGSGYYWSQFPEAKEEHGLSPSLVPQAFLQSVISKVKQNCNFFVVDVARAADGTWLVVELNDGCMSGLCDVQAEELYSNLARIL